mmetsp:Transcript_20367/g.24721  ORF Transcript_20367/g.24721 Transcript_20367/m.24721 type:complete len:409 (-) Transcript_20367:91-1317(-)
MVMITCKVEDIESFKLSQNTGSEQCLDRFEAGECEQDQNAANANTIAIPVQEIKNPLKKTKKKTKVAKSKKSHALSCGTTWTSEEDKLLLDLFTMHGNQWKIINPHFPTRSGSSIRSRYHSYLKKRKATNANPHADTNTTHTQSKSLNSKRIKSVKKPRYVTARIASQYFGLDDAVPGIRKGKRKKMKYTSLLLFKSKLDPRSPNPGKAKSRIPSHFDEKPKQLIHVNKKEIQDYTKTNITDTNSNITDITNMNSSTHKTEKQETTRTDKHKGQEKAHSHSDEKGDQSELIHMMTKETKYDTNTVNANTNITSISASTHSDKIEEDNTSEIFLGLNPPPKKDISRSHLRLSLLQHEYEQEPEKEKPILSQVFCEPDGEIVGRKHSGLGKSVLSTEVLKPVKCNFNYNM